jgi:hypothetical protein
MIRTAERLADDPQKPAGIAVWRFNRFARDFQDAQFYKAHLRRMGYALVSMADDVPNGDFAPIIEALLDWKAEHDNAQVSLDIRRTFSELRAQGYEPGGWPPRGLIKVREELGVKANGKTRYGRRWVADPALADRILQAFTMRASGARYADIIAGPLVGVYRSVSCLPTFFENRRYVDAGIVPEATFRLAQARRIMAARHEGEGAPRRVGSPFLLSGMVRCRCGAMMVGDSHYGACRYYRCGQKRRDGTACTCTQPMLLAERVERPVMAALLAPTIIEGSVREVTSSVKAQVGGDGVGTQVQDLSQRIAETDRTIDRLVAAVARGGEAEGLLSAINAAEAERRCLRQDLLLVEAEITRGQSATLEVRGVAAILEELRSLAGAGDAREMRTLVKLFVDHVTVDGEAVTVTYLPQVAGWFAD